MTLYTFIHVSLITLISVVGELGLEEELFAMLMLLFRSPRAMLAVTQRRDAPRYTCTKRTKGQLKRRRSPPLDEGDEEEEDGRSISSSSSSRKRRRKRPKGDKASYSDYENNDDESDQKWPAEQRSLRDEKEKEVIW